MKKHFNILFLADSGIGNAIEALYAVEYCLKQGVDAAIFLNKVNKSFQLYLHECYGNVILNDLNGVSCKYLIHSETFVESFSIPYEHYFYLKPDAQSSAVLSETEQYLSIVKALFPSKNGHEELTFLKENYSEVIRNIVPENKIVLYPGGSSFIPVRRWPHYKKLIEKLGNENIVIIGGHDDITFSNSYIYPPYISNILPQKILNSKALWSFLKSFGMLTPYAHFFGIEKNENAYINTLSWHELVALLRRCKSFVGNDGGLSHLAGACNTKGFILFGPTSVGKNRPYSTTIKTIQKNYSCQPCQFGLGGITMTKHYVNCPFQVKCMNEISVQEVIQGLSQPVQISQHT